jgi:hypothetical protein
MLSRDPDSTRGNDLYETPEVATPALLARRGTPPDHPLQLRHHQHSLAAMRKGDFLHRKYQAGQPLWSLSGDQFVPAIAAAILTSNASVVPVGDALFANIPGQYWRIR